MSGRDEILGRLRRSLKRGDGAAAAAVDERLQGRRRNLVPARAKQEPAALVDLFEEKVKAVQGTVRRISGLDGVPAAVADHLKAHNLPPKICIAPAPDLEGLAWSQAAPLLDVRAGAPAADDLVGVARAAAGVAETGTLMLLSGPTGPSTLNFLPDDHIVVLRAEEIVGAYEDGWDLLRQRYGVGEMPRTMNFVTGPSRTGDIEQTIINGAHGPRRLHVLLVDPAVSE